jgi:hypothetical protein
MAQDALQTPLDICVCGWYFWPEFIGLLKKIEHRSYIVSHRPLTTEIMDIAKGIPIVAKDNIGLEWGAYDHFLKSIWSGNSNILFCHDDILVQDPEVFNKIALLDKDVVYIFKDKAQELNNKGSKRYASHGRSIFMKSRVALIVVGFVLIRTVPKMLIGRYASLIS